MSAPPSSSCLVVACLSARVTPSRAGRPAPTRRRKSGPPARCPRRPCLAKSSAARPARSLRASGTGWLALDPLQRRHESDRAVRADDDAGVWRPASQLDEGIRHERRGLADGNQAVRAGVQAIREAAVRRRRARAAAARCRRRAPRGRCREDRGGCEWGSSVRFLRVRPAGQAGHDVELPEQVAHHLVGVLADGRAGRARSAVDSGRSRRYRRRSSE